MDRGDVEAARLVGGTARSMPPVPAAAAVETAPARAPPPVANNSFEKWFESRTVEAQQSAIYEKEFHQILVRREKVESAKISMDTIQNKISIIERKLDRLERQHKTDTDLYRTLEQKVDALYEQL